jgi:hypothetical protein
MFQLFGKRHRQVEIQGDNILFANLEEKFGKDIKLTPVFNLSQAIPENNNTESIGKGLSERGLHFSGTVTPSNVRCICVCDSCKQSFSLQHFHAGFSDAQYFYSTNSKETLVVPYYAILNMPTQLDANINLTTLSEV